MHQASYYVRIPNLHINKIQKIQNKFVRIILNKTYGTSITELHHAANM